MLTTPELEVFCWTLKQKCCAVPWLEVFDLEKNVMYHGSRVWTKKKKNCVAL